LIGSLRPRLSHAEPIGSWGMVLSGIAVGFAAFGWLTPVVGALTQEAIDVAVILNALRALRPPPTHNGYRNGQNIAALTGYHRVRRGYLRSDWSTFDV
jgi:hypothetical protein